MDNYHILCYCSRVLQPLFAYYFIFWNSNMHFIYYTIVVIMLECHLAQLVKFNKGNKKLKKKYKYICLTRDSKFKLFYCHFLINGDIISSYGKIIRSYKVIIKYCINHKVFIKIIGSRWWSHKSHESHSKAIGLQLHGSGSSSN